MRRIVLLSSLTVGRCFTVAEQPADYEEDERAAGLATMRSVIAPEEAWRVSEVGAEEIVAENALQEEQRFAPKLKVSEIPRQGWERLVERIERGG